MRKVDKLRNDVKKMISVLGDKEFRDQRAEIKAVYERVPIQELKEIVEGFDDGTLTHARFNEIWIAAGGKPILARDWG